MAWVEIEWPPGEKPQQREIGAGLIFGRSAECDVVIDDKSVSAKHAWIREVKGRYFLINLRSTNGVTINGKRLEEGALHDGDTVGFADVVGIFRNPLETRAGEGQPERPGSGGASAHPAESPADQCRGCGFLIPAHMEVCPRCGMPMRVGRQGPSVARSFDLTETRKFVRVMSSLAFAGGLVGPLLLGIGWVLGMVCGVMVLAGYSAEADARDRAMARRGILLGLLWLTAMAWGAAKLWERGSPL